MDTAEMFDCQLESRAHAWLRETAWIGGDLIEGRYLLGVLLNLNLFRASDDDYVRWLHSFAKDRVSRFAADVFARLPEAGLLIPFLRRVYHTATQLPSMPSRNDRLEGAVECILRQPDASDEEIALATGATVTQVRRMARLVAMRKVVRLYLASNSIRYD